MHAPTHIAIFISSLRGGGAERVMVNLANEFDSRGLRTDLVLARAEGPYLSMLNQSVRVIDFKSSRPLLATRPLTRYLRREKPDALLSALDHSNLIAIAARYLSRVSVRHIVSQHNDASFRPSLKKAKELPNYWLLGPGYRLSDGIVAVSRGVADSLTRHHGIPPHLIRVIYNPIVIAKPPADEQPPHKWLAHDHPPVVLGAGEFITQKGFDTLLKAFKLVREETEARLVILGEGSLRDELEDLADTLDLNDEVLMPGFVDDPWTWMRHSSVFVLSSRWEGLSCVLMEAMACGTPVVSTDCPSGPSEVLEDGKWGRLVPVGEPRAMAKAILTTLRDKEHPPVAKRAADFDLKGAADQYLDALGING